MCDWSDSWRPLNMTMCLILKTNRREMLKTIPRQMMQIYMWTRRKPWYIPRWMNIKTNTWEEWLTEFTNWYSEYVYVITVLWYFFLDTLNLFCYIHKLGIIIAISFKHYCISNLHSTNPLYTHIFLVLNDIISHTIFFYVHVSQYFYFTDFIQR